MLLYVALSECDQKYEPVGCYSSGGSGNETLPELIINDIAPQSPMFMGHMMTFGDDWDTKIKGLICRCARKVAEKGYKAFAIHNDGRLFCGKTENDIRQMLED